MGDIPILTVTYEKGTTEHRPRWVVKENDGEPRYFHLAPNSGLQGRAAAFDEVIKHAADKGCKLYRITGMFWTSVANSGPSAKLSSGLAPIKHKVTGWEPTEGYRLARAFVRLESLVREGKPYVDELAEFSKTCHFIADNGHDADYIYAHERGYNNGFVMGKREGLNEAQSQYPIAARSRL